MSRKIRVLFVAEELCTNGAMISLLALLRALSDEKYAISLFLFKQGGKLMEQVPGHVAVLPEMLPYAIHRMPLKQALSTAVRRGRFDLMLYRLMVAFQRAAGWNYRLWPFLPEMKGSFDVVCCYTDGFVAPMILRKVGGGKKACWIHYVYSKCPQMNYIYDALRKADICVPVSVEAGKDLDRVLGGSVKQHVVHNITDAAECIARAREACGKERSEGVARIVSVGRVTAAKGFDVIPPVARILKDKGLKFEWYVVGDGDRYGELLGRTEREGLSDCVHFIGARPNPMPWIRSADVFVNPSRFESWGMTVSEALCLGKAVITSDIPVFAEQIADGVNGLMCRLDADTIADAIRRVLTDDEFRHRLETNAARYRFTKDSVVGEFDALVEKLSEENE